MYVFGGTNQAGAAQSTVHRMYRDGSVWRAQSVTTSGDSPGARYDHAVAYDEAHGRKRLIVFGGRDDTDELADTAVYALDLPTMAWKKLALGPNSDTPPAARAGHVLLSDDPGKYKRLSASPDTCWTRMVLFGGETGASEYSNEVWMLWLSPSSPDTVEWLKVDPDTSNGNPAGRAHHAVVWQKKHLEDVQDGMVMFGGDTGGEDAASDTWVLEIEWPDDGNSSNFAPEWVPHSTSGASLSGHTAIRDFLETQALYPEIFDAGSNTWTTLTSAPRRSLFTYPHMFLLPSGNLFQAGQWVAADLLKLDENPPAWEDSSWASALLAQSSVMYEPGKVMKCGIAGVSGIDTEVIAFNDDDECITSTGHWVGLENSDFVDRGELNLTILPDGRVLATGGYGSDATTGPQIWDPDGGAEAGSWTEYGELALEPAERGYHSSALLLPSGQIISGGDDLEVPDRTGQNRKRATVYCPPYLFDSNGDPAPRPEIDCGSGHLEMTYGDTVSVTVADPADVDRVSLVRAGAVTHAFNQDQRFIELAIVDTIGTQLLVEAPPDSNRAPPGYWMLFLIDANATPSIASWVRVEGTPLGDPCDTVEPEEIDDLTVEIVSDDRLYFTWQASAADDNVALSGAGTQFGFRYWQGPIDNESAWAQATPGPIEDFPGVYDTDHDDVVDSLQSCTTYYLAMREVDDNANLSALHSQVSGKTLCGGGGGGDPNSSFGEVVNAETGEMISTTRSETRRAGLSTQSGEGGGTAAALVVETVSLIDGAWRFTLRAPVEFEDADASKMLRQVKDASGAWQTRSDLDLEGAGARLGLAATGRAGRKVFPGAWSLMEIASMLRTPTGDLALASAEHSSLGDLAQRTWSGDGGASLASGETLTLVYEPSQLETKATENWFALLQKAEDWTAPSRDLVRGEAGDLPGTFALYQNQPNPFSHTTSIRFDLPKPTSVRLTIYDIAGRKVRTLTGSDWPAGRHGLEWDHRSDAGVQLGAGAYIYRLTTDEYRSERKMILLAR